MRASMRDSAKAAKTAKTAKAESDTQASGRSDEGSTDSNSGEGTTAVKKKARPAVGQLDPLYVIFEQHLFNFQDSDADRKTFIGNIVVDYLGYLRKMNIVVPKSLENSIIEELANQVNTMLVKKIYGCSSLKDYQQTAPTPAKRRARERYGKLSKKAA